MGIVHYFKINSPRCSCDLLILSGPVPKMVTSSYTPTLEPEIAIVDTSPAEQWLFESKEPMQYLQSLVSLPPTQYDPSFKALDIWPREYFTTASGEVLNRLYELYVFILITARSDISNASFGTSSGIGTIQVDTRTSFFNSLVFFLFILSPQSAL